jgi:hypothetical protein
MYITATGTVTYTVVDIRKAFEGFESDLRMIARRTNKWSMSYVDQVFHDIAKLAEAKYLSVASIVLTNTNGTPVRAAKFIVNSQGTAITSDRAGGNDWENIPNTTLKVILEYTQAWEDLTAQGQSNFQINNDFQIGWTNTSINTSFPNLTKTNGQLYASKGYELQKQNYR